MQLYSFWTNTVGKGKNFFYPPNYEINSIATILLQGWFWHYIIHESIFTNPSVRAGYDTRSIFKRSLTGLNSEFSFSLTSCLAKAEEPSPSYYLPIAGGRIIGFIPFPRVLVLCEMQLAWSRIWTRVAMFISHDDNHYTTGTRDIMVTVVKMDTAIQVQILDEVVSISHSANTLRKDMNPTIVSPTMDKRKDRLGLWAEKSEFKPVKLRLKIDFVSHIARRREVGQIHK